MKDEKLKGGVKRGRGVVKEHGELFVSYPENGGDANEYSEEEFILNPCKTTAICDNHLQRMQLRNVQQTFGYACTLSQLPSLQSIAISHSRFRTDSGS